MLQNSKRKKIYQVVQRPDRLWEVRRFGRQISTHGSETQAIDYALTLARAGQKIEVQSAVAHAVPQ